MSDTVRVKVRMTLEAEYDIELGSEGYGGADGLFACIEIDRNQFLHGDALEFLSIVRADPKALHFVQVVKP